jgi:hypothetical protein
MIGQVNLIGQDKHGCCADATVVEQFVQFLLGGAEFVRGGGIDHVQDDIATFGISWPFRSILLLTANLKCKSVYFVWSQSECVAEIKYDEIVYEMRNKLRIQPD